MSNLLAIRRNGRFISEYVYEDYIVTVINVPYTTADAIYSYDVDPAELHSHVTDYEYVSEDAPRDLKSAALSTSV